MITGTADDDTLTIDLAGQSINDVIPAGDITFDGGAGFDALVVSGAPSANPTAITHTFLAADEGNVDIDGTEIYLN